MLTRQAPRVAEVARLRRPQPSAKRGRAKVRRARRVLVPVDGSDNSLRALDYVSKRVRAEGEPQQLIVLNVQPRVPTAVRVSPALLEEHYSRLSEAALAPVRRFLERRKMAADVRVLVGEPAPSIVDLAQRTRCSEIVIGSRGLGSLKGLLLGSVTTKVIHLSDIPVVVVP